MIVNYDRNTFIVQATVIMIANYNCYTFIVQATGLMMQVRLRAYHLLAYALNLLANIRLNWYQLSSTNTLAYLQVGYGEKSYTTFIFALDVIKRFCSLLTVVILKL
jgi:hypothetical protein